MNIKNLTNLLHIPHDTVSHGEKLITALGCFLAIFTISFTSHTFISDSGYPLLIASMGASSILLFAVPHSPFSSPWSFAGGQMVSAFAGITALLLVPDAILAAAVAVSLAALLMYFLRCLHPPGGATALAAVMGGAEMEMLGYQFVMTPVLFNSLILLVMSYILNNLFPHRGYPSSNLKQEEITEPDVTHLTQEDLESAIKELDIFIDASQSDLAKIYQLAQKHAQNSSLNSNDIKPGHYYSNAKYGDYWSVRWIVDEVKSNGKYNNPEIISYRTVAGKNRSEKGTCTREEFASWAKHEVFLNENLWQHIDTDNSDQTE